MNRQKAVIRRLYKLSKMPIILYIEKEDKEKYYDKILSKDSPIGRAKEIQNKHVFLLAAFYGFLHNAKNEITNRRDFVRTEYFTEEDKHLLFTLAVKHSSDLHILNKDNYKEVFTIIEEYANAGVKILFSKIFNEKASFKKILEADLVEQYNLIKDNI